VTPQGGPRREQVRRLYGFDFPEDFWEFWRFAGRLRPLEPLNALAEPLGIHLVGPFEVLAGRFDRHTPRLSPLLHWRYAQDPAEFFTVLSGDTDGLHWGYYLDDPGAGPAGCVAYYYASDAFDLSVGGDTLFEAVRLELEYRYADLTDYLAEDPAHAADYEAALRQLDDLRSALRRYATGDRFEQGGAYTDRYQGESARAGRVVAATLDGMGVVVPPEQYRPLALADKKLWHYLAEDDDPAELVGEARAALREGFPGTALKLGKDLWAVGGGRRDGYAFELLDAAYAALGRRVLREVLRAHRAHRDLPSVDVFENEALGG
jgi:hypothetical protein